MRSKRKTAFFPLLLCLAWLLLWLSEAAGHGAPGAPAGDLGEMVVTGDKIDAFIRENPAQVVSMGAKEIESRNFLQVQEVLGAMPGVDVRSNAGGMGTRISIRGGGGIRGGAGPHRRPACRRHAVRRGGFKRDPHRYR